MRRSFFLNLLFLLTINVIIKPFYLLGIDRTVQNTVGPEEYGFYWGLFNFIYLFQVVNDLGLQNYTSTFISQNRQAATKYFGHLFGIKGLASLLFVILVSLGSWLIGYRDVGLLVPIIISQIAVSIVFFFRSTLAGLGHYTLDSALSVLDKSLMIFLCGYLIWFSSSEFTIYTFAQLQAFSLLLTMVICGVLVWQKMDGRWVKWDFTYFRVLWRKSAPFALVFILTTLMTRTDSVMIERMLPEGAYEAGIYAAGFRLLEACNMLAYMFIGLLLPMFSHIYKDLKESKALLETSLKLMILLVTVLSATSYLFAEPIMNTLYTFVDDRWPRVFVILMISFVPMGLSYIGGAVLLAHHQVQDLNRVYGLAVVINILGNVFAIPAYGALGAALVTFCTQSFVTLVCFFLIFRKLTLTPSRKTFGQILAFVIGVALVVGLYDRDSWAWEWWYQWATIGVLFVVWGGVWRLIPWDFLTKKL